MRVVSLVPSWTEFLHDLDVQVVGQTKFCVRPRHAFREVPRIGGTKTVHVEAVLDLKPDLVVANREENERLQVEQLEEALGANAVCVTDIRTVRAALKAIKRVGARVDRIRDANEMAQRIEDAWGEPVEPRGEAGYAVWASPWMIAGHDTYIHDVMRHWGIRNIPTPVESTERYPTLGDSFEEGASASRTWLLPSEPFPFGQKHLDGFQSNHPRTNFLLVDGEAFSWYGSRMLHVTQHLREVSGVGHENFAEMKGMRQAVSQRA